MEKSKLSKKSELIKFFKSQKNKIALEIGEKKITYTDLVKNILIKKKEFYKNGFKKACKIAVDLENSEEFIYIYFVCFLSDYTIIPISNKLNPSEKKRIYSLSKPDIIITNTKIKKFNFQLRKKIFKRPFLIFYTSGTTAEPKGVCHDFRTLIDNAIIFNTHTKLSQQTRFLSFLPMGYMAGFLNSVLSPLLTGGTIVILRKFGAWEMFNLLNLIIEKKINTIWLVPSIINYLNNLKLSLNIKKQIKDTLKNIFVGTAPYHDSLKKTFQKKFRIASLESYGMTEILLISSNQKGKKNYGSGKLLPNVNYKILNGEICFKTNTSFKGYYEKNSIIKNGNKIWFSSGDIATVKNRYLKIKGRKKNLIIKDGVNISPIEIENLILKITKSKKCLVISKETKFAETQIIAYIENKDLSKREIFYSKLKKYMPKKFLPDKIFIIRKFKLNHAGKIDFKKL